MKHVIKILFIIVVVLIAIGYYYKNTGDHTFGDKLVGIGILTASFILMPFIIYYRWKNKNVKDYMLTEENLNKMRDYEKNKEKNNV